MGKPSALKNSPGAQPSPAPAPARPAEPCWTAATIARELGVPLELVLELGHGNTVFVKSGRDELQAAIEARMAAEKSAVPAAAETAPTYGDTPPAPELHKEDLTLSRVFPWSPRLLANRSNGLEVVLQVKSPRFLKAGLVLRDCVQGETCWFYYGRLPRGSGETQLFMPTAATPPPAAS